MDFWGGHFHRISGKFTLLAILIFFIRLQIIFGVSVEKDLMLSAAEKNALIKFRENVSPLLYRDFMKHNLYLVRWLRAQKFDIRSAEAALRAHIKWRKENKIDTILEEDWSDMLTDYYATTDTYDKNGRPIIAMSLGEWDVRSGMLRGQGRRLLRYQAYLLEDVTTQVFERQQNGMNVTQWNALCNAEGFNLVLHACPVCIPLWIQFIQIIEAHYPGWANSFIVFAAPQTISVVLEATRPFMSSYTKGALKILGPNKNRWMKYLDQYIARNQRTPAYGGTKPTDF